MKTRLTRTHIAALVAVVLAALVAATAGTAAVSAASKLNAPVAAAKKKKKVKRYKRPKKLHKVKRPVGGITGVWSGKTKQTIEPLSDDGDFIDWSRRISVRAYGGQLTAIATEVRFTCPGVPSAGDILINMGWKIGRGPRLKNNSFSLVVTHTRNPYTGRVDKTYLPVHLTGVLGEKGATGSFSMGGGGCSGKGTWDAKRNF